MVSYEGTRKKKKGFLRVDGDADAVCSFVWITKFSLMWLWRLESDEVEVRLK